jgi:hypothetical protein
MHILTRYGSVFISRALSDSVRITSPHKGVLQFILDRLPTQLSSPMIEEVKKTSLHKLVVDDTVLPSVLKILSDTVDYYGEALPTEDFTDSDYSILIGILESAIPTSVPCPIEHTPPPQKWKRPKKDPWAKKPKKA